MHASSTAAPTDIAKRGSRGLIAFGVLTVLFGLLAIAAPLAAGLSVALMVGILVLVSGVMQMAFAFAAPSWGRGLLGLLLGLLTVVCGGLMIAHPLMGLSFLTLMLSAYFIAEGICEILFSFQIRPDPGWVAMLLGGVLALILGVMIWRQWPVSGEWAIGLLVGVKILFSGWTMVLSGGLLGGAARELANQG